MNRELLLVCISIGGLPVEPLDIFLNVLRTLEVDKVFQNDK